jgi:hypothetical protein
MYRVETRGKVGVEHSRSPQDWLHNAQFWLLFDDSTFQLKCSESRWRFRAFALTLRAGRVEKLGSIQTVAVAARQKSLTREGRPVLLPKLAIGQELIDSTYSAVRMRS